MGVMTRETEWQRSTYYTNGPLVGGPLVIPLGIFNEGDTLIRTRIDMQLLGLCIGTSVRYPVDYEAMQVVVALLWDEGSGGGEEPPGYFDTALFPWIWVQLCTFENTAIVPNVSDPTMSYSYYTNTAESRSIDCHSQRLTSPGNSSNLWLVLDSQVGMGDWAGSWYIETFSAAWSVGSKLAA